MSDIINATGQIEYYLRDAKREGLTLPAYVTAGHYTRSLISFQFTNVSDVRDWALHFGVDFKPANDTSSYARCYLEDSPEMEAQCYALACKNDGTPVTPACEDHLVIDCPDCCTVCKAEDYGTIEFMV